MSGKLSKDSQVLSAKEFSWASCVVIATAVLSIIYWLYDGGHLTGRGSVINQHADSTFSSVPLPSFVNTLRLFFIIAFISSAIGLRLRNLFGLYLSVAMLLLIKVGFLWWYIRALAFKRAAGISHYSELNDPDFRYVGVLHGATWWDISILVIASILFIWLLNILIFKLAPQYRQHYH